MIFKISINKIIKKEIPTMKSNDFYLIYCKIRIKLNTKQLHKDWVTIFEKKFQKIFSKNK